LFQSNGCWADLSGYVSGEARFRSVASKDLVTHAVDVLNAKGLREVLDTSGLPNIALLGLRQRKRLLMQHLGLLKEQRQAQSVVIEIVAGEEEVQVSVEKVCLPAERLTC
jgi:hypothetical protein